MAAITVHNLLNVERSPGGEARIEVGLSERPDDDWIDAFGRQAQAAPTTLLSDAVVYPTKPSVELTTNAPLTTENDREVLEWLHAVVAATNDELAT